MYNNLLIVFKLMSAFSGGASACQVDDPLVRNAKTDFEVPSPAIFTSA